MKKLTEYFFKGLLFLIPLLATVYVLYILFIKIDRLFSFDIPGVGFVVTILTITCVGFIASNFLTRGLVRMVDRTFTRLPLIKMIYTSIKDLTGAFVGDKKSFNRPVLVRLAAGSDIRCIGFVTREDLDHLGISESVAVYLPQSYNFAGNLVIVPREHVTPLRADSGEVMAFIVSGGLTAR